MALLFYLLILLYISFTSIRVSVRNAQRLLPNHPHLLSCPQLGQHEHYISSVLPLVQDSLSLLEEDVAVAKNVTLAPELIKAVHRRRLVISRGGRRGEDMRGGVDQVIPEESDAKHFIYN